MTNPLSPHAIKKAVKMIASRYQAAIDITVYLNGKAINLDLLFICPCRRRRGVGTKVLTEIKHICDSKFLYLTLTPDSNYGMSVDVLRHFYSKNGFCTITQQHPDFLTGDMVYEPVHTWLLLNEQTQDAIEQTKIFIKKYKTRDQ